MAPVLTRTRRLAAWAAIIVYETIYTLHSEVLTFGESFGARDVTFALSLPPKVLEALRELAGASEERIAEAARSASPPSATTVSVHLCDVTRGDADAAPSAITPSQPNQIPPLAFSASSRRTGPERCLRSLSRSSSLLGG